WGTRKLWLSYSLLRFSRWEDWPRGSSPPSPFRAQTLRGKFPPTPNERETTQSISSIDSTTHSACLAEGTENLHRQVLRTGSSAPLHLLLRAHSRLPLQPLRRKPLRPQPKLLLQARRS